MEPSRIHELNKIAGAFCGKEMEERNSRWFTIMTFPEGNVLSEWSPCTDHNQAAEVKAMLREKAIEHESRYDSLLNKYLIRMSKPKMAITVSTKITGYDESELLAFAMAVEKMREGERYV